MITPKTAPGFNEYLPAEQRMFDHLVSLIRTMYERHGFTPLETPALELAQVLLAKEGGETAKQVYRFMKGDTDLALRFDLTVPLARYVAEHYHDLAFPFRRYQIQEAWRAEKAQAGRYRQFYQCDIDILGNIGTTADADILLTTAATFKALGLGRSVMHISNRKIFVGFLASLKLSEQSVEILRIIDRMAKQSADKTKKDLSVLGLPAAAIAQIISIVNAQGLESLRSLTISNTLFQEGLAELTELDSLLRAGGLTAEEYVIDLGIVRGLDYYTGMVFETLLVDKPEAGSMAGGGRYDNLVGHYRKEPVAGVGASIGISRLFNALKDSLKKGPATPAQALIIVFSDALLPYCFKTASTLRAQGINVMIYPGSDKPGKQMAYANKIGVPFVVLCGEEEAKNETLTIKNMASGDQQTMKIKEAVTYLAKSL